MRYLSSAVLLGVVSVGGVLSIYTGLATEMWNHDSQWICVLTLAVAAVAYVLAFRKPEIAHEVAPYCMRLGLFGTVAGFITLLASWGAEGFSDISGSYAALYTTAVGLVCATVLELQAWSLRDA